MGQVLLAMIFLPLGAAVLVALLGSRNAPAVRWLSLVASITSLVLSLLVVANYQPRSEVRGGPIEPQMVLKYQWLSFDLPTPSGESPRPAHIEFFLGIDGISLWLVVLTALLMVTAVLVSWESIKDRVAEYYALLLVLETAMLGVFCAFDLVLFYIFFEFTLIPLFFLIGIWGGPQKRYAARKFFIYTLAGSVISLVGLVAIVLALHSRDNRTFTFSIPELAKGIQKQMSFAEGIEGVARPESSKGVLGKTNPERGNRPESVESRQRAEAKQFWYRVQVLAFLALFAGFAIKVPLVPFHTWLPLAHVEAPTAGSVLLAGVLLKLGTYGFLRLCLPLLPYATWNIGVPLIAVLSVIGILYGALCSLAQDDIKKLVAYSSVSHLGFCMLGMFALNEAGVSGSVLQMVNHGLSTGALFLLVGMLYERYHTRQLSDLGGLTARVPVLAFFMVFISLSSLGLPGLNGFVGEVLCLIGMFRRWPVFAVLGAVGIILAAWYLLNMLQKAFFGPLKEPAHGDEPVRDLKTREIMALAPIAALCLFIGVYPQPLLEAMKPDVKAAVRPYQYPERLQPPEPEEQN